MLNPFRDKSRMIDPERALPGRETAMPISGRHQVLGTDMTPPFPEGTEHLSVGMGCFWGAERAFWTLPGVFTTAVGYQGGHTPNATYAEACSGSTGHTEAVLVVWHPDEVALDEILRTFWEGHDPTQGMRQGNDTGTQYRSAIYASTPEQYDAAIRSRDGFQALLSQAGHGAITTEIGIEAARAGEREHAAPIGPFYYAEEDHQQYLHKVPWGYCGHGETGVSCPVGLSTATA